MSGRHKNKMAEIKLKFSVITMNIKNGTELYLVGLEKQKQDPHVFLCYMKHSKNK